MTKRVKDFESWTRQVERRIDRLERLPHRSSGGGGSGSGAIGGYYYLPFEDGVGYAGLPDGVLTSAYVVGSFAFESEQEVGLAVSIVSGIAMCRAPVSDDTYEVTLIFVNP